MPRAAVVALPSVPALIVLRPNSAPAMVPSTEMPVCSLASDACCSCAWTCCSARRIRSVSVAIFGANFCRSRSFSASRVSRSFRADAGAERRLRLVRLPTTAPSPRRRTASAPAPAAACARSPSATPHSWTPSPPPPAAPRTSPARAGAVSRSAGSMSVSSADAQSTTTAPEPNGTSFTTSCATSTPRFVSTKRTDALANSAGSYSQRRRAGARRREELLDLRRQHRRRRRFGCGRRASGRPRGAASATPLPPAARSVGQRPTKAAGPLPQPVPPATAA